MANLLKGLKNRKKSLGKISHREAARVRRRVGSALEQDIGDIPQPIYPERRAATLANFELFLSTYFPQRFTLAFSDDHHALCRDIQASVETGDSVVTAMPRSSGKTTIIEMAPLWGYLRGLTRFGLIVAANGPKAIDILESIKIELLRNDKLCEDFPEVCIPIRHVDDEPRRCKGQRCNGKRTGIQWASKHIRFAQIAGRSPGGILMADGMSAALRGLRVPLMDGSAARPDLVLIDDPQTDRSAKSESMTLARWELIFGCIKGLQAANKRLSIFAMVTIIRNNDLACRLLDPQKTSWRIVKTKSIYTFPINMELWREYYRTMREDKLLGGSDRLNKFYLKFQLELEEGAKVAWPQRIIPGKMTALQGLMEYYLENPKQFMAEHQQEPTEDVEGKGSALVNPVTLARKINGFKRRVVPVNSVATVMYIDTHDNAFFWCLLSSDKNMTPFVIDYSTWPEQSFFDFQLANIPRKLSDEYPDIQDKDARIYQGGIDLVKYAMNLKLDRWDGRKVSIDAIMADTGYKPEIWQKIKDRFPAVTLTKGIGITCTKKAMAEWESKPDRQVGHHWVKQYTRGREHPLVYIDVNHWKTVVAESMASPIGQVGSLTIYGDEFTVHDLYASHAAGEVWTLTSGNGRVVNEWKPKPAEPDIHWWDCTVGCFVGFNMLGIHPPGFATVEPENRPVDMSASSRKRL